MLSPLSDSEPGVPVQTETVPLAALEIELSVFPIYGPASNATFSRMYVTLVVDMSSMNRQ